MWEWIAFAAGIGFGIMGLAAYIKTNLESKQREKDLQVKIEKLEERSRQKEKELQYRIGELMKGQIIDPRLLITREKDLINSSSEDIWILGINALGVFHESFEDIISFIKNGGKARVLLLNPESEAFKQREKREEGINGEKSGRLRAEYATSIAFCKDIIRLSNKRKSLDLRVSLWNRQLNRSNLPVFLYFLRFHSKNLFTALSAQSKLILRKAVGDLMRSVLPTGYAVIAVRGVVIPVMSMYSSATIAPLLDISSLR